MGSMVVRVRGVVQDVGFRWATRQQLADLGLRGAAENFPDGSVRIEAVGEPHELEALLRWLRGPSTPGRVHSVEVVED